MSAGKGILYGVVGAALLLAVFKMFPVTNVISRIPTITK